MNTILLKEKSVLAFEEREMPSPQDGEVIIEVAYCGICRTDRKCYQQGQRDLHMPRILGHEVSGTICAVGKNVKNYAVGDPVALYPGIGCGECENCLSGNDQICHEMQIFGFHLDGGFSRYCLIPEKGVQQRILQVLPPDISLKTAALCEPLSSAVHMLDQAKDLQIRSMMISGGGAMGFMMASLCRHYGIKDVVVIEPNSYKRDICKKAGFKTMSPNDAKDFILQEYPMGIDGAIPCCPYTDALELALNSIKNGGFLGLFSGLIDSEPVSSKTLNQIHYKELTVKGTYGCGSKDFKKALELILQGFDLSPLPIHMVSPDEVENILCQKETPDAIQSMIDFTGRE